MEPKENSIPTGIVVLWGLLFLFQLLASQLTSALAPTDALPGCPQTCGDVEIPYPFGIGPSCSMEASFTLNCTINNGTYKPFLNNIEFLSISLLSGQARVANHVESQCYNATSHNRTYGNENWHIDLTNTSFRFSSTLNKFTAVGCDTLAYIAIDGTAFNAWSGCVSLCVDQASLRNGSCSGIGCCQTAIPEGLDYYYVGFDYDFNGSDTYNFSPCSYAILAETTHFNFSISYVTTDVLQKKSTFPVVLDWAIGNETCLKARQNNTPYACVSNNSVCVDSHNGPGYLCNCSMGYQGNPYLPQGCQDIDECANKNTNRCSSGVCQNTKGSYKCLCPSGTSGNPYNGTCNQNQKPPAALKLATGKAFSDDAISTTQK